MTPDVAAECSTICNGYVSLICAYLYKHIFNYVFKKLLQLNIFQSFHKTQVNHYHSSVKCIQF